MVKLKIIGHQHTFVNQHRKQVSFPQMRPRWRWIPKLQRIHSADVSTERQTGGPEDITKEGFKAKNETEKQRIEKIGKAF